MIPIVVFASGRGSNFDAIHEAIETQTLQAEIKAVISDQPNAPVLVRAKQAGIQALSIPFPKTQSGKSLEERRREHEEQILKELIQIRPHFLVMAGYMRIVTRDLIEAFRSEKGYSRIVNIHPSLLPSFPGTHSYAQAYRYGVKVTGVTVHLVEPTVDSGPICAQEAFSIADCQSEEEVQQRGLEIEHRLYPTTLDWVLSEKFKLEKQAQPCSPPEWRFCVRPN